MNNIIKAFRSIGSGDRNDDDAVDRLSSRYTVTILIVFAISLGAQMYVGSPITCWCDKHFTGDWVAYANAYCWVKNTYYVPLEEDLPNQVYEDTEIADDKKDYVIYYQWMPFILLGQAAFFFFPSLVWHGFNQAVGVDADNILKVANGFEKKVDPESRSKTLSIIKNQMDRFLGSRKQSKAEVNDKITSRFIKNAQAPGGYRRYGCYLVFIYLLSKLLYLANVVGQFFLLNRLLGFNFSSMYGLNLLKWMLNNNDWTATPHVAFPRVTMCDFTIRRLGNNQDYTVQCTLPINMYTEKIYMFLWFWILMVMVITIFSLLLWFARCISFNDRLDYVKNHLRLTKRIQSGDESEAIAARFAGGYLRHDGVFLLRLIGHNTNTLTVSEIIGALFDHWDERKPLHANKC